MQASIVGLAFSTSPRDADYVPVGHRALGGLASMPFADAIGVLGPVLADRQYHQVGPRPQVRRDRACPAGSRAQRARHGHDAREATCLTRQNPRIGSKICRLEHTAYKAIAEENVCGKGVRATVSSPKFRMEAIVDYAGERAELVGQLAPLLEEQLAKEELTEVYQRLELPLVPVLVAIERAERLGSTRPLFWLSRIASSRRADAA